MEFIVGVVKIIGLSMLWTLIVLGNISIMVHIAEYIENKGFTKNIDVTVFTIWLVVGTVLYLC